MDSKLLSILLVGLIGCIYAGVDAGPAYPQHHFDSWDDPTPPLQPIRRPTSAPKALQGLDRQQFDELDKQTQVDLKVLSHVETELNLIFSCYIRLTCPRMRSAKVLSECDKIKDWPLYHQVMKMAGIRRYPYQSYAPNQSARIPITEATVDIYQNRLPSNGEIVDEQEENENYDNNVEGTETRYPINQRRTRRGYKHHH